MLIAFLLSAASIAIQAPPPPPTAAPPSATTTSTPPRRVRDDGMVADYYPATAPVGGRVPGILLLGGSEGGLSPGVARQARELASRGYAVLHLSYFGSPGQPRTLKLIPIETFTRGLDWLKAQPDVDGSRIGIVGGSKGAEAALLVATRRSDVRAVVLGSPSSVAWPGIDRASMVSEASWAENGRPVTFTPYGFAGEWKGILALYADGLAGAGGPRGTLPVERVNGAVIMVCGEKDALWPSCPMARTIQARLKGIRFAHPVTLLSYPEAGHAAFGPPSTPEAAQANAAMMAMLGGTVETTTAARTDGWPKVLAGLDAAMKPSSPATP